MTIKQIADAVGKPERTVRDWALRISRPTQSQLEKMSENITAKSAAITAKIAASSPNNPPDYDLEETLAIIETGLGKNAAAVYRESATRSDIIEQIVSRLESKLFAPATLVKHEPKQITGRTQKPRFYGVDFDTGLKIIDEYPAWPLDGLKFRELVKLIESDIDDFTKARHHVGILCHYPVFTWKKDDFARCWRYLCQKRGW